MTAFWISLFYVFIAEMGDKTQLVALAFATRYSFKTVMGGVFLATLLVHVFSVVIGQFAGWALPEFWIRVVAGLAFIGFGIWTLRGDELEDDGKTTAARFGPLLTVATTFFLAELGDKTMLATVTLAAQYKSFIGVWLGSTLGMVVADGLAVGVGRVLKKNLPEKPIKIVAAIIFLLSGVYFIVDAFLRR